MLFENFFYKRKFAKIGSGTKICKGKFIYKNSIYVDDYCYVGPDAYWFAQGEIKIGAGTIIGPMSKIWTANHNYNSLETMPYDMNISLKKVEIGRGCWIGMNVNICPGVSIGDGCVIAMGSVISGNVPSYSIVGGNPAKIIRMRDNIERVIELINEEKFYLNK
ncbi:acyltransferase [Aeromonas salmonicida]|uniref:acyltransferase n=1 Tax=Aeromonas salmonicida TaxID=645 RepID=UPI00370D2BDC